MNCFYDGVPSLRYATFGMTGRTGIFIAALQMLLLITAGLQIRQDEQIRQDGLVDF